MQRALRINPKRVDKKRILIFMLVFVAVISGLSLVLSKTAGKNDENTLEAVDVGDYSWRFDHYTDFLTKQDSGSIRLMWTNYTYTMKDGENTIKQRAIVYPISLKNKSVKYEVSDEKIAQISPDGDITIKKPGVVKIKAILENNGEECVAKLTVKRNVDTIFLPKTNITINTDDPYEQIKTVLYPEDATEKTLVWSSSDNKVAMVDDYGTLKPVGKGMAQITVKTQDGRVSAKCFVTVVNKVVKPSSVEMLGKDAVVMEEGQSITMIATVSPSNAKDKTLKWSSSNKGVATISPIGKIKAISEGTTTITVKTSNGITDEFELNVAKGSGDNPLVLYNKKTSANEVPKDVLGNSYVWAYSGDGDVRYVSCASTLEEALNKQMSLATPRKLWTRQNPQSIATRAQVLEYMNPQNYRTGVYKYQFLDLARPNGLKAEDLNRYLEGKGTLEGMGQAFIDVANAYNISEIYLVLHACLETGHGKSQLASGVTVNGRKVYNMFGIAAYDESAVYSGSQKAYKEGWFSPEAAIRGGGKWISENYVNHSGHRQNTLYDIIWNPEAPGTHQYATDISWAIKQAENMAQMFEIFPNATYTYEVPVYAGETAPVLE